MKKALSGPTTSIVITASRVSFVSTSDLTVGSKTVSASNILSADSGLLACVACPIGWVNRQRYKMYQPHENMFDRNGHNKLDDCSPCDAEHDNNLFAETEGMDACLLCNFNVVTSSITSVNAKYTSDGSNVAVTNVGISCDTPTGTCPQGKWSANSNGIDGCSICPAGTYQDVAGSSIIVESNAADTLTHGCKQCHPGFYLPLGTESNLPTSGCLDCQAGMYANTLSSDICINCGEGKYLDITKATADTDCKDCVAGMYSDVVGMVSPVDKYVEGVLVEGCTFCPIGKFASASASGKVSEEDGCMNCEIGKYQKFMGSVLVGSGQQGSASHPCKNCPKGYYSQNGIGYSTATESAAILDGDGQCTKCLAGMVQTDIGKTDCDVCDAGKKRAETDPPSENCVICLAGFSTQLSSASSCSKCAAGKYQEISSQETCKDCPTGYYRAEYETEAAKTYLNGAKDCELCAIGEEAPGKKSNSCGSCNAGKYNNLPLVLSLSQGNITNCVNCPSGYVSEDDKAGTCTECLAGTVQTDPGQSACDKCNPGKKRAETDSSSADCLNCPSGFFSKDDKASTCTECPSGFTSGKGDDECRPPGINLEADIPKPTDLVNNDGTEWYPLLRHATTKRTMQVSNLNINPTCTSTSEYNDTAAADISSSTDGSGSNLTVSNTASILDFSFVIDLDTQQLEVEYGVDRTFSESCKYVIPIKNDANPEWTEFNGFNPAVYSIKDANDEPSGIHVDISINLAPHRGLTSSSSAYRNVRHIRARSILSTGLATSYSLTSEQWVTTADCNDGYLQTHLNNNPLVPFDKVTDLKCVTCPTGAACANNDGSGGGVTFLGMMARQGYARVSWNASVFAKCNIPDACIGVKKKDSGGSKSVFPVYALLDDDEKKKLEKTPDLNEEKCRFGHSNTSSEICDDCESG